MTLDAESQLYGGDCHQIIDNSPSSNFFLLSHIFNILLFFLIPYLYIMKVTLDYWHEKYIPNLLLYANNEKITDNVRDRFPSPYTEEDARAWVALNKDLRPALNMVILAEGRMAGAIGISVKDDIHRKNAEIGYWVGEPFWGKGIATEAVRLMVSYTFRNFDVTRIYGSTFHSNIASQRVLEKNEFIREARLKNALFKKNRYFDEVILSFLKQDFRK